MDKSYKIIDKTQEEKEPIYELCYLALENLDSCRSEIEYSDFPDINDEVENWLNFLDNNIRNFIDLIKSGKIKIKKPVTIPKEESEIIKFIHRFKNSDWLSGNCYYFTTILKSRFNDGIIFYDVINGHFLFKYQNRFFDYSGEVAIEKDNLVEGENLIQWDKFDEYDPLQKERIIRDCIL